MNRNTFPPFPSFEVQKGTLQLLPLPPVRVARPPIFFFFSPREFSFRIYGFSFLAPPIKILFFPSPLSPPSSCSRKAMKHSSPGDPDLLLSPLALERIYFFPSPSLSGYFSPSRGKRFLLPTTRSDWIFFPFWAPAPQSHNTKGSPQWIFSLLGPPPAGTGSPFLSFFTRYEGPPLEKIEYVLLFFLLPSVVVFFLFLFRKLSCSPPGYGRIRPGIHSAGRQGKSGWPFPLPPFMA